MDDENFSIDGGWLDEGQTMNELFDNLLVSSPNGGGLFFVDAGKGCKLDSFDTTGLSVKGGQVIRGIQPSRLQCYQHDVVETTGKNASFDDIHDVYLGGESIYLVATAPNAIIQLDRHGEELQRWVLPGEQDSHHVNCLANWNGKMVYSAFGEFSKHYDYKGKTEKSGYVNDLSTGERLISGLSQPHSLVPVGRNLLLANSERQELAEYGPSGDLRRRLTLDGYTRGICAANNILYVGLSCSRNIDFPGVGHAMVVALDSETWEEWGRLPLPVAEIYALQHIANRQDAITVLANIASASAASSASAMAERDAEIRRLEQLLERKNEELMTMQNSALWLFGKYLLSFKHQMRNMLSLSDPASATG